MGENAEDGMRIMARLPFGDRTRTNVRPDHQALVVAKVAVPAVRWAFVLLERNELDVGLASTRGQIDALTDGLLILRYMFGMRDAALIADVIAPGAPRTPAQIEALLHGLMP